MQVTLRSTRGWTGALQKTALLVAACLLAGLVLVSVGSREQGLSEMMLQREGGTVTVIRDGERLPVEERFDLRDGDVVVTGEDGQVTLRLRDERAAWLSPEAETRIVDGDTLESLGGSLLVRTTGNPTDVGFGDVRARFDNALFRLDLRAASATAASYGGEFLLASPGQPRRSVPRYHQASVAAGAIGSLRPYQIDAADPWDRLWLSDLVELDEELERLGRSFSNQVKGKPGIGYFREVSGGKRLAFMRSYMKRRPAELMIGYTVADQSDGLLKDGFTRALGLRDDGGSWGIVAGIMEIKRRPLVAALEDMFLDTGVVAGGSGGGGFEVAATDGGGASGNGTGGGTEPTGTLVGSATPGDPGDPGPGPSPTPNDPTGGGGSTVQKCVEDLQKCADEELPSFPDIPDALGGNP